MKISKEQKELNRQTLLNAGIDLMVEEGIREATMRKIALKAGLSEPVIYKYFPTKDHLLVAYFGESIDEAIQECEKLSDFFELPFSEQIQLLFDAQTSAFSQHKKFVGEAFHQLFLTSFSGSLTYLSETKGQYTAYVQRLIEAAVEAGEIHAPPGVAMLSELLWDFHLGMIYYWLQDQSEGHQRTLQLLDKSLSLFTEFMKSNVLNKVVDLFYFFAREHFLKIADGLSSLSPEQKLRKSRFLTKNKEP